MKRVSKVFIGVGILLVVFSVVVALFLGPIIKTAVQVAGPQVAGVDITLDKATVNLLSGHIKFEGFVIGNPAGFKTPSAMELGRFVIAVQMRSLFTDTIVIKQIHIDGAQVTYEQGLRGSNLGDLQKNLTPSEEKSSSEKENVKKEMSDQVVKKVIIEDFLFENGKMSVSLTMAGGKKMTVPLPEIHLENIGKKDGGTSLKEATHQIFRAITQSAGKAIASSTDYAGGLTDDAGKILKDAGGATRDAAKNVGGALQKGLGGLLGK